MHKPTAKRYEINTPFIKNSITSNEVKRIVIIIIIIIGTTAPLEPRSSSEASASCPYSLQHSSNFSLPTSRHLPSHHLPSRHLPSRHLPSPITPSPITPSSITPSPITPYSHLSFALPLCLLPSTTSTRTLHVALCSSIPITCPAHFSRLILMYVTIPVQCIQLIAVFYSPFSFVICRSKNNSQNFPFKDS